MPLDEGPPTSEEEEIAEDEFSEDEEVQLESQIIINVMNRLLGGEKITEAQAQEVRQVLYAAGAKEAQQKLSKFIQAYISSKSKS
ncbi:hypothetical protein ACFLZH_04365 [Patescibacteria group bacterium]